MYVNFHPQPAEARSDESGRVTVYADETLEDLQRGGFRLIQSANGFRHGTDSVLLAAWAASLAEGRKSLRVADLGAGNGAVSLLLAARRSADVIAAFEKDIHAVDLLRRNIKLNHLVQRMNPLPGDLRARLDEHHLPDTVPDYHQYDLVVANPPYHIPRQSYGGCRNREDHHEVIRNRPAVYEDDLPLDVLMRMARRLLKPQGRMMMVHHPRRLPDLIEQLRQHRFALTRLRFVHSGVDRPPVMLLLEARLYGRPGGFRAEAPLILEQPSGTVSPELAELYGHDAALCEADLTQDITFCRQSWCDMAGRGDEHHDD